MDDLYRIPSSQCAKVFIPRDYSEGTTVRFHVKFPPELDGKVDVTQLRQTVNALNAMYAEAETLTGMTYCESCFACLTAYLSYICFSTHYEKTLKKIKRFVENENQTVYVPRGLMLIDPVDRGLRTLEICILTDVTAR